MSEKGSEPDIEARPFNVAEVPQADSGNRMQGGMEQKMQGWPPYLLSDREIDRVIIT